MQTRFLNRLGCCASLLMVLRANPSPAQTLYFGAGIGPSIVLHQTAGAKTTYLGTYGVVGLEWPGHFGLRLEGTETYGFLWLSGDLVYTFTDHSSIVQPYSLAGFGFRTELANSAPIATITTGFGVQGRLGAALSLFADGRVHHAFSSGGSVLLLTAGITLAP